MGDSAKQGSGGFKDKFDVGGVGVKPFGKSFDACGGPDTFSKGANFVLFGDGFQGGNAGRVLDLVMDPLFDLFKDPAAIVDVGADEHAVLAIRNNDSIGGEVALSQVVSEAEIGEVFFFMGTIPKFFFVFLGIFFCRGYIVEKVFFASVVDDDPCVGRNGGVGVCDAYDGGVGVTENEFFGENFFRESDGGAGGEVFVARFDDFGMVWIRREVGFFLGVFFQVVVNGDSTSCTASPSGGVDDFFGFFSRGAFIVEGRFNEKSDGVESEGEIGVVTVETLGEILCVTYFEESLSMFVESRKRGNGVDSSSGDHGNAVVFSSLAQTDGIGLFHERDRPHNVALFAREFIFFGSRRWIGGANSFVEDSGGEINVESAVVFF